MDRRIPYWLKALFTLWVLLWASAYFWYYGPQNYLWLCNIANFLILLGLWRESRLLLSAQLLAVLLIGLVWGLDVTRAFVTGSPPVAGTDYMFDPQIHLGMRLLSTYHMVLPFIVGYAVYQIGYEPRGLWFQTGLTWLVIPVSYFFTDPERHINWAHPPFEAAQGMPGVVYVPLLMVATPLLVYLPAHALVVTLKRRQPQPPDP